jgi:enoyl-CoA hydratase/carnithine racemase
VVLNRPHRRNAFTLEMLAEWADFVRSATTDPDVRVMVVTGADKAFCSGVDISVLDHDRSPIENKRLLGDHVHPLTLAIEQFDKPLVAAVNGPATGAGMDLALMCDIRIAARSARFAETYVKVGLIPGDGGCYFLPRLVGLGRALELLLTGDFIDADEADRIGLVNHVVDDDELMEATGSLTRRLAALPSLQLQLTKRATYQSLRGDLRTALDLASSHQAIVQATADSREALRSFLEKRAPRYEHSQATPDPH